MTTHYMFPEGYGANRSPFHYELFPPGYGLYVECTTKGGATSASECRSMACSCRRRRIRAGSRVYRFANRQTCGLRKLCRLLEKHSRKSRVVIL